MKPIVKKRWIDANSYVEVHYRPDFANGHGMIDVYCFVPDPRKAQHHKPKHWCCGSTHGLASVNLSNWTSGKWPVWNKFYAVAQRILKEISLTSSVGRAAVSSDREPEVVGSIPASGSKPFGIPYRISKDVRSLKDEIQEK